MIESGMLDKRQGSDREEKVETQLNSHLLDTWTSTRSSILNVSSSYFEQHILLSFSWSPTVFSQAQSTHLHEFVFPASIWKGKFVRDRDNN